MKESSFVKQNRKKWNEFEGMTGKTKADPDRMSELFVEITDDLAYSRTFYNNRSIRVYLNYISQLIFGKIYKNRKVEWKKALKFWTNTVPLEVWYARKSMLTSLLVFGIAILIGVVSSADDIEFVRVILGDGYVDMTQENINNSDPMAVYKGTEEKSMFLRITFNNIQVAVLCFVSGILLGLGTFYMLMNNGIMLGAFQYFFYAKGILLTSVLTIWIHGTIEITSIVIAGGAGFEIGKGLMFPGTYTRLQSLQMRGMRAMKIMMGLIPLFFIAGFFEGFVTRHTEWPTFVKAAIILGSLALMVFYFVILPWMKGRKLSDEFVQKDQLLFQPDYSFVWNKIKSVGLLFNDAIAYMRIFFKGIGFIIFPALVFVVFIAIYNLNIGRYETRFTNDFMNRDFFLIIIQAILSGAFEYAEELVNVFSFSRYRPVVFGSFFLIVAYVLSYAGSIFHNLIIGVSEGFDKKHYLPYLKKSWYKHVVVSLALSIVLTFLPGWMFALSLFVLPHFMIFTVWWISESKEETAKQALNLSFKEYFKTLGLMFSTVIIWLLIASVPGTLSQFAIEPFIEWNIITVFDNYREIIRAVGGGVASIVFVLSFPFVIMVYGFHYFSIREKAQAVSLKERLAKFGTYRNQVSE